MSDTERVRPTSAGPSVDAWTMLAVHADVALCLLDRVGNVREVTPAIEGVTGFGADHYRGTHVLDHVHTDDGAALRRAHREIVDLDDGSRRRFRVRLGTVDLGWRWVEVVATREFDRPEIDGLVVSIRDIDADHHAVEELRTSEREARNLLEDLEQEERFLRILLDAASDAVVVVGADLAVRWVSPSIERMAGWSLWDLVRMDVGTLVHPDDADIAFDGIASLLASEPEPGRSTAPVTLRIRHKDDTWHWMSIIGHDLRHVPSVAGLVFAFRDVHERTEARRAIETSERRFRALVQHGSDVVYTFGQDLIVTTMSDSFREVLGFDPERTIGLHAFEKVVPEDLHIAFAAIDHTRGRPGWTERFRVRLFDSRDEIRWVDGRVTNLVDSPDVGEWVCNFWDVTESVDAEQALAASERRFEAMVRNSNDFIVVADEFGVTRYASPAVERLLGFDASELVGRDWGLGIPDEHREAIRGAFRRVVDNPTEIVWVQICVPHSSGGSVWLESVLSNHLDDPEIQGIIGNFRDVTEQRHLIRELETRSEVFQSLAFSSTTGLFEEDSVNGTTFVNERWIEITGTPGEHALAVGWRSVLEPEMHPEPPLADLPPGHEPVRRIQIRHADGSPRWIDLRSVVLPGDEQGVVKRVGGIEDVTAIVDAEEENQRLVDIFDLTDDIVILVGERGELIYLNASGRRAVGLDEVAYEAALGTSWLPDSEAGRFLVEATSDSGSHFTSWTGELSFELPDGSTRPMSMQVLSHRNNDDEIEFYSAVLHDISERKQLEASLERQATHDPLTGLPNRTLLFHRIAQAIDGLRSSGTSQTIGVLFIDLDHFKVINDSLGHALGDRLLRAIGERIRTAVRPGDTVARFGGDEFVVLCERLDANEDAAVIAHRVETTLQAPFLIDGHEIHAGVSIGISYTDALESDPAAVLRDADTAMYQAKSDGRGRWVMFDDALRRKAVERQRTETALRQSRHGEDLVIHYQPVVDLRTGRVRAVEALVRWNRDGESVGPDEFVPIAEETGLIVPIGSYVLDTACRQVAEWQRRPGWADLAVSVNVSARQLQYPGFVNMVQATLESSRIEANTLSMEITESVLFEDVTQASLRLQELRSLGIRIAVDDFGTGYSSLTYLDRLPVDLVKLDRSFVAGVGTDPTRTAIVTAVVNLALALGLDPVAEGIETEQQRADLYRLGCVYGQGFLIAPPMSAAELEAAMVVRWGSLRLRDHDEPPAAERTD